MLLIHVDFPQARYSGQTAAGGREFPPAPTRLLSALLSSGNETVEFVDAVQRLEGERPLILADSPKACRKVRVPLIFEHGKHFTGADNSKKKGFIAAADLVEGINGKGLVRTLSFADATVMSRTPRVSFVYAFESLQADESIASVLSTSTDHVGYLGRSEDPVVVSIEVSDALPRDSRVVYEPNSHGAFLPCPLPGFVQAAIERYHNQVLPLPTHHIEPVRYSPTRFSFQDRTFIAFSVPVSKSRWSDQLYRLNSRAGEAVFFPLTLHSGQLFGIAAIAEDHEVPALTQEVLDTFGPDVEANDTDLSWYTDSSDAWLSHTPVLASRNSVIAEAQIRTDLIEKTPLEFENFEVYLRPNHHDLVKSKPGYKSEYGLSQWLVEIVTTQPITGPLAVGAHNNAGWGWMRKVPR